MTTHTRLTRGLALGCTLVATVLWLAACTTEAPLAQPDVAEPAAKVTNRIDVPQVVRDNLGITFAKVELRHIAQTLRVPGRFESLPDARRRYAAPLAGRVELAVAAYERVKPGDVLYRLDAPAWRDVQSELDALNLRALAAKAALAQREAALAQASRDIRFAAEKLSAIQAVIAASEEHSRSLEDETKVWSERLAQLEDLAKSGSGKANEIAEARAQLADAKSRVIEEREKRAEYAFQVVDFNSQAEQALAAKPALEAEVAHGRAELVAAAAAFSRGIERAASLAGYAADELMEEEGGKPRWQTLARLEVQALAGGVVEPSGLTSGAWAEAGAEILSTLEPNRVIFKAKALQADMPRLMAIKRVRLLPPSGGVLSEQQAVGGLVQLGLEADADERLLDLLVTPTSPAAWARPGVSAEAELVLATTDDPVLAIPLACVVRDELDRIYFRRDPNDADKVIRIQGKLGVSDGRWIEVKEDVMEGDEVVVGGVYELKLTGSGKATGVGHFHADGTWHAGGNH